METGFILVFLFGALLGGVVSYKITKVLYKKR